jgi:transglutaminase-like putative cysteine protease
MLLEIEHQLTFQYDAFVNESYTELRVEPRRTPHQTLHSFYLAVGPPTAIWRYVDWNGNFVHHFGIPNYHDRIEVATRSVIETHPVAQSLSDANEVLPIADATGPLLDFTAFGGPVIRSPELEALLAESQVPANAPLGDQLGALSAFVLQRFDYVPAVSDYRSTTEHLLATGAGVCQDFAHILIGLLRLRGIPSRYVSGYLHVESGENAPSQSHAWVEAWSPTAGWLAVDPTHDQVPDERYVVVAHGRDYDDVPPNRGIFRGNAGETLQASVHTRQSEDRQSYGLQDEIGEIDVPDFSEVPHSPQTPSASLTDDDSQSQQQQQQ